MSANPIETYLNDHLGGAMLGSDLAMQIADSDASRELEAAMRPLAEQIEEDRQTLVNLMDRLEISPNPVKKVMGWAAEKASRIKFSDDEIGTFLALETLALGVRGKMFLWEALLHVEAEYAEIDPAHMHRLIHRAEAQLEELKSLRHTAGHRALRAPVSSG